MRKFLLVGILCCIMAVLFAQQDAEYGMYRFNGLYINPAYAGSHEVISAAAFYRHQWVNIPGQPQSASVAIHSPLKNDKVALGLIYTYDRVGVTRTNSINADFAYRIPIGKKKLVRFCLGISAGATNYNSNLNSVATTDPNDPNFEGNSQNRWLPNVGFGLYVYSPRFFVGVSLPHILTARLNGPYSVYETNTTIARQYYHLVATAGYVFNLGKKVKFMPSVMMKYVPVYAPISFDFNGTFVFVDRVWIGAGYRLNDSYNFMLAVNATRQWRIGYSYELTTSPLSHYTTGTHEVMMSFDFDFKRKGVVSPRTVKYF